jgi:polysaccharide deacetylase 2 family uncharacterized protein YibQ
MVKKKKERRIEKGKRIQSKGLFLVFGILLGSLIIFGLFLYLFYPTGTNSLPIYEEPSLHDPGLKDDIKQVDLAIYKSLYLRGIAEKDIYFPVVSPRYVKGYEWDFTELLIKLPRESLALQLEKIINSELSELRPMVVYNRKQISPEEMVYDIYINGLFTHKLRLTFQAEVEKPSTRLPNIAIIIDDLGYDRNLAMSFIQLDMPISLSVLPIAPYTKHIVKAAKRAERDLILHLPMEPNDYPKNDPGPGALLVEMNEKEVRDLLEDDINRVPGLKGVNNHMGSLFSEKRDKMLVVLSELKKRDLFYIDSETTQRSVGYDLAKALGVPTARRSVFLDNDLSLEAIRFQMERLLGISRYKGNAIGIGHPHEETLKILHEYLHQLKTDFTPVYVSELVSR